MSVQPATLLGLAAFLLLWLNAPLLPYEFEAAGRLIGSIGFAMSFVWCVVVWTRRPAAPTTERPTTKRASAKKPRGGMVQPGDTEDTHTDAATPMCPYCYHTGSMSDFGGYPSDEDPNVKIVLCPTCHRTFEHGPG